MDIYNARPSGATLSRPADIGCTLVSSVPLDTGSLDLTATSPTGEALTAISGGVIQSGWAGSIIYTASNTRAHISLTTWPSAVDHGTWAFDVAVDDFVEV